MIAPPGGNRNLMVAHLSHSVQMGAS